MKYKYNGQWYDLSCSLNVSNLLIGEIIEYAGESIPGGYLVCDGSAVSRTEYSELFDVIGTIYGSGDGSTTFNLPDLKGRISVGLDSEDTDFNTLGKTSGEKTHKLTVDEMPSHRHTMNAVRQWKASGTHYWVANQDVNNAIENGTTTNTGGDQPHNNLQPYITINYLIRAKKTKNVLASGSTVVNSLSGDSTVDAPSVRAVNEGIENAINEINDNKQDTLILGNNIVIKDGVISAKERTWKKVRTITIPSDDYKGQEIDGVKYGYHVTSNGGIKSITFSTDKNGELLSEHSITGAIIKLTPTENININQGFVSINSNGLNTNPGYALDYITNIKATKSLRWFEYSLQPFYASLVTDNPGRYRYPAQYTQKQINNFSFGGHEATSVLGEGTKLEIWMYGYWD